MQSKAGGRGRQRVELAAAASLEEDDARGGDGSGRDLEATTREVEAFVAPVDGPCGVVRPACDLEAGQVWRVGDYHRKPLVGAQRVGQVGAPDLDGGLDDVHDGVGLGEGTRVRIEIDLDEAAPAQHRRRLPDVTCTRAQLEDGARLDLVGQICSPFGLHERPKPRFEYPPVEGHRDRPEGEGARSHENILAEVRRTFRRGYRKAMAAPSPPDVLRATTPFADALDGALEAADSVALGALAADDGPIGRRDAALALSTIHDLHLGTVPELGDRVSFQHHPAVSMMKHRLESGYLARLPRADVSSGADDPVAALRQLAAADLVPEVYDWLARDADLESVQAYLTVEGGPDGGFDDLVAICQVGLDGEAKGELARNYWDEMGRGKASDVHTELHRRMASSLDLRPLPRHLLPVEALERSLLGSTLATNRALQPELVGALGLIELQAGPRCRRVIQALERLGADDDALDFYREHAVADPRHGKDWLDHVVAPLARRFPEWSARMVTGARWRSAVNARFFAAMTPATATIAAPPASVRSA